jgi:hypothetical protein
MVPDLPVAQPGAPGGGIPIMPGQFIPPNGFAGFSQQTPAVQAIYRGGRTMSRTGRRRKKKAAVRAKGRSKPRKSSKKLKRLVKGSAAAKRYMSKIRKMKK